MKHATLRQLKVFESVARLNSFSRAAEELHLTQPAVSIQIAALVSRNAARPTKLLFRSRQSRKFAGVASPPDCFVTRSP